MNKGIFLHHIALRATDFDKSMLFYTEGLGMLVRCEWTSFQSGKRAALLSIGDNGALELYEGAENTMPSDFEFLGGCFFHMAVAVDDVDAAYEAALSAGGIGTIEPGDGMIPSEPAMLIRKAFVQGPSGELIELFKER